MSVKFKTNIEGTAFNDITELASVVSPVNGVAAVGTSTTVARQDHVHGTDTSRAPTVSPTFTGTVVLPSGQALIAPALGTPSSGTLTNCTFPTLNQSTTGNADTATKIASIANDNIVQLTTAQTLSFKTLFRPTIQGYARFEGGTSGATRLQATAVAGTTVLTLPAVTGTLATLAGTETLGGKTLNSPTFTGTVTGISKSMVDLGNVDNTSNATERAAAATLTNKTLTTPIISSISNTGTLTLPTSTDTLVGRATTDTLTNKTLRRTVFSTAYNITLQASDAGKVILLSTSGVNVTIPINQFTAGDEFTIINDSQGSSIGACTITAATGVKAFIVATQYQLGASFSLASRRGVKFICTTGGSTPRFYGWRS